MLVLRPTNNFNYYNGSRKPFPSDIEHFRDQTAAESSVKNRKLLRAQARVVALRLRLTA
jgi:hypothetical protein